MLDIRRMKVLREVAAKGSFSAAAEALNFTQSAVSQHIAALERETGTQLVERFSRGVRLTEAGTVLVTHADVILARLESAEEDLAAIAGLRGGRLRLVCFQSAGATVVPRAVATFHGRHPDVELSLREAEPDEAALLLKSGDVDLALVYDHPATMLVPELELTHLLDDCYDALLPAGHPLAERRRLSLSDLTAVHPGTMPRALKDAPVRRVLAARVEGGFHSPASDAMLQIFQDVAGEFSGPRLELAAS